MANYLRQRLEGGYLNYNEVFAKAITAKLKDEVTALIVADDYTINQDGTVTKD